MRIKENLKSFQMVWRDFHLIAGQAGAKKPIIAKHFPALAPNQTADKSGIILQSDFLDNY